MWRIARQKEKEGERRGLERQEDRETGGMREIIICKDMKWRGKCVSEWEIEEEVLDKWRGKWNREIIDGIGEKERGLEKKKDEKEVEIG